MKIIKVPPHVVMNPTKEVIFYVSNNSYEVKNIHAWLKELNLTDYKGMVIKSKCIFNRLKNEGCT